MNFLLILLLLTLFTGAMWILERFRLEPRRRAKAREMVGAFEAANREAIDRGEPSVIDEQNALLKKYARKPWYVEYTADIFPVILLMFIIRSFLWEPFRIPSGSMLPTLQPGDFILVNKYDYGIRLPVIDKKIISIGEPKSGDVVVFRYPMDPSIDYIKRVIGVPGDTVEYRNKVLYINGVEQKQINVGPYVDPESLMTLDERKENLKGYEHEILIDKHRPDYVPLAWMLRTELTCSYSETGFVCKVPQGKYLVMGDNRDNSQDSRYWGFMPEENLVGRAMFIWFNLGNLGRIGSFK